LNLEESRTCLFSRPKYSIPSCVEWSERERTMPDSGGRGSRLPQLTTRLCFEKICPVSGGSSKLLLSLERLRPSSPPLPVRWNHIAWNTHSAILLGTYVGISASQNACLWSFCSLLAGNMLALLFRFAFFFFIKF